MREITTCPREKWEQKSTEELDRILQEELRKEHPDENVVLPILREIESREKDIPAGDSAEVSQLRDKLSEHSTPTKRRPRNGWVAGIAAVAAVACIVVMALPKKAGAESIIDVLFRWTSSIFEFVDPDSDETKPQIAEEFVTDNPGLQQLHDKLTELGVTENVVPMWLPEDYSLMEIKEKEIRPSGIKVDATFINDDSFVTISYRMSTNIDTSYEKEGNGVEIFEYADAQHFLIDNENYVSVTWVISDVECLLNTDLPKNEIRNMIKSIYGRKFE